MASEAEQRHKAEQGRQSGEAAAAAAAEASASGTLLFLLLLWALSKGR